MDSDQSMPEPALEPEILGTESPKAPAGPPAEAACTPKTLIGPGRNGGIEYRKGQTPRKPGFGPLIIAKREFMSNLKSVRMLVMILLFVLAVIGGTYGFASLSSSFTKEGAEVLSWTVVGDMDSSGLLDDYMVTITDQKGVPLAGVDVDIIGTKIDGTRDSVLNVTADANGRFTALNLGIFPYGEYYSLYYRFDNDGKTHYSAPVSGSRVSAFNVEMLLLAQATDLDGDNINDDIVVVCRDINGSVIAGADITIEARDVDTIRGTTDAQGIFRYENLVSGGIDMSGGGAGQLSKAYTVHASHANIQGEAIFVISEDDESISRMFDIQSPDQMISIIAQLFITMLAPIIGIVLAYDSISKERLQNSLDFLLCRPTPKSSVIFGKFMGLMAAIGLPVTLVNLGAVGIISSMTGEAPSAALVAGFIVSTLMLMAIFILLQMVFSTLVTSTGTAILSGIGIWLLFVLFWSLITLALNLAIGNALYSDPFNILSNQLSLGNPVGAYQLSIASLTADAPNSIAGVPDWSIWASMAAWLGILLALGPWLFAKRSSKL